MMLKTCNSGVPTASTFYIRYISECEYRNKSFKTTIILICFAKREKNLECPAKHSVFTGF